MGGSSHLAVGPGGEVAVRISAISASANQFDAEADSIAVSTDNGSTWQIHAVPGNVDWDATFSDPTKIPRWVEPAAWGPGPILHHLWSEGADVYVGSSTDLGARWKKEVIYDGPGVSFFPYLTSNANGDLAATWFVQKGDALSARVSLIRPTTVGLDVMTADPFSPLAWLENKEKKVQNTAGEYIPSPSSPAATWP